MLCLLERLPAFHDLESDILNLKSKVESISRQLGAWLQSLRDSDLQGERFVTDKLRRSTHARGEREEFLQKLERIRKGETAGPEQK